MSRYLNLTVEQAYNAITEILSVHCNKLALNSAANLLNQNLISERVVLILLNHLYDYELENTNKKNNNHPGCDLIDNENKILVSISSTQTKNKILKDLNNSSKHYPNYRFIYFCLTCISHNLRNNDYKKTSISFDPKTDILDFKSLMTDILHDQNIKKLLLLLVDAIGVPESLSYHKPEIYLELQKELLDKAINNKLLKKAKLCLSKNDFAGALSLLNLTSCFIREILILKAGIQSQMSHSTNPIKTLDLILKKEPNDIEALKLKAKYLIDIGDPLSAKTIYELIYTLDNQNQYWIYCKDYSEAIFHLNQGNSNKSLGIFITALNSFKGTNSVTEASIHYEISLTLIQSYPKPDMNKALDHVNMAIEILAKYTDCNDRNIHLTRSFINKAKCFRLLKRFDEAASSLVDAEAICSESTITKVYLNNEWGLHYLSLRNTKNAVEYLNKVINNIANSKLHELKIQALANRAICHKLNQDYKKAIVDLETCIDINKDNNFLIFLLKNHKDLAVCYHLQGNEKMFTFHISESLKVKDKYFPDLNLDDF